MAGDAFSRFKTKLMIFFSVRVKKELDPSTSKGKLRLNILLAAVVFLVLCVILLSDSNQVDQSVVQMNDYGSDRLSSGVQANALEEDDEEEEEDADSQDDESEEEPQKDSGESLKIAQHTLQAQLKSEFMTFFSKFATYAELNTFLQLILTRYSSVGIISSTTIGQTYEKRNMEVYSVGKGPTSIVVVGTADASEWTVPMSIAYSITRLSQLYGINEDVTNVLDKVTLHFIPLMNPDGFEYSHTSKSHDAKHYHKNRAPVKKGSHSKGTDINDDWSSFSQLESQAVNTFALSLKSSLGGFLSMKCCDNIITAVGVSSCSNEETVQAQKKAGEEISKEVGATGFKLISKVPKKGSLSKQITNWASSKLGVNLAFEFSAAPVHLGKKKSKDKSKDTLEAHIVETSRVGTKGVLALAKFIVDNGAGNCDDSTGTSDDDDEEVVNEKATGGVEVDDSDDSTDDDEGGEEEEEVGGGGEEESEEGEESEEEEVGKEEAEEEEVEEIPIKKSVPVVSVVPAKQSLELDDDELMSNSLRFVRDRKPISPKAVDATEDHDSFLYFAYGPDMFMDVLFQVGLKRMERLGTGLLKHYRFDYTYFSKVVWKSGVGDILKSSGSHVYGVLFRVPMDLKQELESLNLSGRETSHRDSVMVTVEIGGKPIKCLTFKSKNRIAGDDILDKYKRFKPSRQYRNCVIRGAKTNGFPSDYIEKHLRSITPMYSDKIGSMIYRNPDIGPVCDVF